MTPPPCHAVSVAAYVHVWIGISMLRQIGGVSAEAYCFELRYVVLCGLTSR